MESLPRSDAEANAVSGDDDPIGLILRQAAESPRVALIMLGRELRFQTRRALAVRGLLKFRLTVPVLQALSELHQYGFPVNLIGSLKLFEEVRNKMVHGSGATDEDMLRAIDSGITILNAINALPSETNVVHDPHVAIYEDEDCTKPVAGAWAVMLETISPGGAIKSFRIFPTTRTHFKKGMSVAWEWNNARQWGACWYRDPDSGKSRQAWGGSMEFIGRNLDEV